MKSFYEMLKIIEVGTATPVSPTSLTSASNPAPPAQTNPTGAQQTAQNKVNIAQATQDQKNKQAFIKQLKDLLKKSIGITA
jgi:hypothetical protein